jgi:hypothetical protein
MYSIASYPGYPMFFNMGRPGCEAMYSSGLNHNLLRGFGHNSQVMCSLHGISLAPLSPAVMIHSQKRMKWMEDCHFLLPHHTQGHPLAATLTQMRTYQTLNKHCLLMS